MTSSNNGVDNVNHVQLHEDFYENMFRINSTKPELSGSSDQDQKRSQNPSSESVVASRFHVQHCDKCINVRACQKTPNPEACPIVPCRLGCLHLFHSCKAEEHEEILCPKAVVPCINAQHGCPVELERQWTGIHLQTCPASVVVCTVEWNRKPLAPWQSEHFESWAANPKDLDIAATRRDELTVKEYYKRLPQSLRSLLRTNDKKQAIMPLGVAGTRIPKSILAQAAVEKCALKQVQRPQTHSSSGGSSTESGSTTGSDSEEDDSSLISYSEPSYGIRKSPSAGLQQSVCSQLVSSAASNEAPAAGEVGAARPKRKSRVKLSPTVDVVVKDACKYMNLFTFMCAHEFRRDEYAAHFHNVHTEIVTQLNGWLWTRCPMALQGCDYGVERMYPCGPFDSKKNPNSSCGPPEYEIIRNSALDSFCVRQINRTGCGGLKNENSATANDTTKTETHDHNDNQSALTTDIEINSNEPVSICDLPVEVLVHLFKYLDPLSLNALTMVNKLLLSVCQLVVVGRGIVVLDWEKVDEAEHSNGYEHSEGATNEGPELLKLQDSCDHEPKPRKTRWVAVDRRWMFSTHFTPIRHWRFLEPGHMSNHMATCPYLAQQRNRPSAPFCYPVTKDNL